MLFWLLINDMFSVSFLCLLTCFLGLPSSSFIFAGFREVRNKWRKQLRLLRSFPLQQRRQYSKYRRQPLLQNRPRVPENRVPPTGSTRTRRQALPNPSFRSCWWALARSSECGKVNVWIVFIYTQCFVICTDIVECLILSFVLDNVLSPMLWVATDTLTAIIDFRARVRVLITMNVDLRVPHPPIATTTLVWGTLVPMVSLPPPLLSRSNHHLGC